MGEDTIKPKILVVDDHEQNLIAMQAVLSGLDAECEYARSGPEALELASSREYAVILLDVQMPVMDGYETARRIRQQEDAAQSRRTPVIFVTAIQRDELSQQTGYQLGAVDYLFKPLDPEILKYKVSVFVELFRQDKMLASRQSEEQFRVLADSMPQLAWMADSKGRLFWCNRRWYEYTGATPEQDQNEQWTKFQHADHLRRVTEGFMRAVATGEPWEDTFPLRAAGGGWRWFLTRAIPIAVTKGGAVRWFGTNTDVTTQFNVQEELERVVEKRTEDLVKSRAFLDSLVHNLPSMVFVKDAKELRYVGFNRAGEELIGISRAEILGKTDFDVFPREVAESVVLKDREVLAGINVVDISQEEIETRRQGRRYLHTKKIPILGADGKPEFLLGISDDITEQRNAERERLRITREQAALEERERAGRRSTFLAEASTLLASSLDYRATFSKVARLAVPLLADWCTVVMVREDRTLERVGAAHRDPEKAPLIEELAKYKPATVDESTGTGAVARSGKSLFMERVSEPELRSFATHERHLEILKELGASSLIIAPVLAHDKAYGSIVLVSSSENRLFNSDDLAVAEELGRRAGIAVENAYLYEAAQKAIRTRDEFLSIASHELKTPITSLKLQLQMTRRAVRPEQGTAPAPEKLAKVLDVSNAQINRLTSLVDDLLDVSRIGAGRLAFNFEAVDLSQIVREVLERFQEQLRQSACTVTVSADRPVIAWGDRFRLEQVVVNLLSNAAKYGAERPIEIRVEEVETGAGKMARLIVADRGIGIAAEKQDKIFERFERAVSANNISGLGLGLYITKEIVNAHGGEIRVQSEKDKGSTFVVDLPREARTAAAS